MEAVLDHNTHRVAVTSTDSGLYEDVYIAARCCALSLLWLAISMK